MHGTDFSALFASVHQSFAGVQPQHFPHQAGPQHHHTLPGGVTEQAGFAYGYDASNMGVAAGPTDPYDTNELLPSPPAHLQNPAALFALLNQHHGPSYPAPGAAYQAPFPMGTGPGSMTAAAPVCPYPVPAPFAPSYLLLPSFPHSNDTHADISTLAGPGHALPARPNT
jgi:hypothetical protein